MSDVIVSPDTWWKRTLSGLSDYRLYLDHPVQLVLELDDPVLWFILEFTNTTLSNILPPAFHLADKTIVRFTAEFQDIFNGKDSAEKVNITDRVFVSLYAKITFYAMQKALSRRTLGQLPKFSQLRLLVCLVNLLRAVTESKADPFYSYCSYINLFGDTDSASIRRKEFQDKRDHLIRTTTYYIRHLVNRCFPVDSPVRNCIVDTGGGFFISYAIFTTLHNEIVKILQAESAQETEKSVGIGPITKDLRSGFLRYFSQREHSL